ncbi:MAG: NAD(P)H-dependent oxidoreductase subunit E, partial [Chloroflexota bacterium]
MNDQKLKKLAQEEQERQARFRKRVFCCTSTACLSAGAGLTRTALDQAVAACECDEDEVEVVPTGCMGLCSRGPLVRVESKDEDPVLFGDVSAEVAQQIVARYVPIPTGDGDAADEEDEGVSPHDFLHFRSALRRAGARRGLSRHVIPLDLPFFAKQVRIVLSETGQVNPEKLEDYLAHGGYQGLTRVLGEMS